MQPFASGVAPVKASASGFSTSRYTTELPYPQPLAVAQPQAGAVSPEDLLTESLFEKAKKTIRLVADDRTNSLIVYANDDGVKRVREMLETIDKPLPSNFRTFALEHAEVDQIIEPLTQIVQGMRGAVGGPRGATARGGAALVPDTRKNVIHVLAEREDMKKVEEFIKLLDVEIPEGTKHIVELANLVPSQVTPLLANMVNNAPATPSSPTSSASRASPTSPRSPSPCSRACDCIPREIRTVPTPSCFDIGTNIVS